MRINCGNCCKRPVRTIVDIVTMVSWVLSHEWNQDIYMGHKISGGIQRVQQRPCSNAIGSRDQHIRHLSGNETCLRHLRPKDFSYYATYKDNIALTLVWEEGKNGMELNKKNNFRIFLSFPCSGVLMKSIILFGSLSERE